MISNSAPTGARMSLISDKGILTLSVRVLTPCGVLDPATVLLNVEQQQAGLNGFSKSDHKGGPRRGYGRGWNQIIASPRRSPIIAPGEDHPALATDGPAHKGYLLRG